MNQFRKSGLEFFEIWYYNIGAELRVRIFGLDVSRLGLSGRKDYRNFGGFALGGRRARANLWSFSTEAQQAGRVQVSAYSHQM